ncbi:glutathione synthetase-like [Styela clava]
MNLVEQIKSFMKDEKLVTGAACNAVDFAITKGILMRTSDRRDSSEVVQHAPFTLFPSPVPSHLMDQAKDVQKDFGFLMHVLSQDQDFLKSAYSSVLESDEFTKNLFDIYETTRQEKPKKAELALIRSDYMLHQPDQNTISLKQIEVNMIASSFNGIGTEKVTALHEYNLNSNGFKDFHDRMPENLALPNLADGMLAAWNHYGQPNAVIVFIISDVEQNIFDQRTLEFKIIEKNPDVRVRRYTLGEVADKGKLDSNSKLFIAGEEIAVAYYRAGYTPNDYLSQKEWDARRMLDCSDTINCPSAGHQLVGAKKMQEVLTQPGVLEKFIKGADSLKRLRDTFVGFYGLEMGAEGDEAVAKVLKNPDNYVLKPQLEGGGNNLYNQDLVDKLNEVGSDKRRCSYIIMEKVRPMPVSTIIIRAGSGPQQFKPVEGVSELGIYGVFLASGDKIIKNTCAGHLLRTKASHHDDGGVAAGVAVLDSPLLV